MSARGLVAALATPAARHIGCRLAEAELYDFASPWNCDSRASDFCWHLHTTMPRLLWTPALLLAFEISRLPRLDA